MAADNDDEETEGRGSSQRAVAGDETSTYRSVQVKLADVADFHGHDSCDSHRAGIIFVAPDSDHVGKIPTHAWL